jgi:hypothetical protein
MDRYVTEEQRSHRPIFIATLRAACLFFASRIQPKFTAAPLHQSLTWCTGFQILETTLYRTDPADT